MKRLYCPLALFILLYAFCAFPLQAKTDDVLKLTKNLSEPTNDVLKLTKNLSAVPLPATAIASPANSVANATTNTTLGALNELTPADDALTITEDNLWNRIREGYAIPNLENHLVTSQTNWYSSRLAYLQRIIQRGSRYLYHVVNALDKRGMPTDLALLPFIESAFNPQAISTAKASGMWQFMPATGRDFNLRQNIFKDERRGVLDSTEAALDYLQRLHGIFGDWQLALAAYNWGEGSVLRAIKKQRALGLPIDFDSLSSLMPTETKNYVPKLQAVKNIIGNPELFNIDLPRLDNTPYFTSVKKDKDIDVSVAAKLAEIPLSEFKALNPQFNRPVITGGNNTSILLPIENASVFESNFLTWKGPLSSWTTVNVNKTERVELLASRLGYQANLLRDVNAIPAKMFVKAGSTILVPKSPQSPEENISSLLAEQAQLTIEKGSNGTRKIQVKVARKENIASIAKRYKVSIADVKSWNKLPNEQVISGQKLVLHVPVQGKSRTITASKGKQKNMTNQRSKLKVLVKSKGGKKSVAANSKHGTRRS